MEGESRLRGGEYPTHTLYNTGIKGDSMDEEGERGRRQRAEWSPGRQERRLVQRGEGA